MISFLIRVSFTTILSAVTWTERICRKRIIGAAVNSTVTQAVFVVFPCKIKIFTAIVHRVAFADWVSQI